MLMMMWRWTSWVTPMMFCKKRESLFYTWIQQVGLTREGSYFTWNGGEKCVMASCKVSPCINAPPLPTKKDREGEKYQKNRRKLLSTDSGERQKKSTVTSRLQKCFVNSNSLSLQSLRTFVTAAFPSSSSSFPLPSFAYTFVCSRRKVIQGATMLKKEGWWCFLSLLFRG